MPELDAQRQHWKAIPKRDEIQSSGATLVDMSASLMYVDLALALAAAVKRALRLGS